MNWVRHGSSATYETKSCHCRVARQPCRILHGSSTTCFQTSRYCRAKVEFNSVNLVRHGSSTTFETGLRVLIPSKKHHWTWFTRYSILTLAFCVAGKAETVPDWLKALDLGQYESSLMANGFDNIRFLVRLLRHKFMFCGSSNVVKLTW